MASSWVMIGNPTTSLSTNRQARLWVLVWATRAKLYRQRFVNLHDQRNYKGYTESSMRSRKGRWCSSTTKQLLTYRYFSIRIKPGNVQESVAAIEKKWHENIPGRSVRLPNSWTIAWQRCIARRFNYKRLPTSASESNGCHCYYRFARNGFAGRFREE